MHSSGSSIIIRPNELAASTLPAIYSQAGANEAVAGLGRNVHSAIVETFLPAPLKPNFLMVLRSQLTVGPSSILLLLSIKKEGV
jgi:hypothetical protein